MTCALELNKTNSKKYTSLDNAVKFGEIFMQVRAHGFRNYPVDSGINLTSTALDKFECLLEIRQNSNFH